MDKKHELISDLKRITSELGRTPSKREYLAMTKHGYAFETPFKLWSVFLAAAGLDPIKISQSKAPKEAGKFKYTRQKLDSFTIHNVDIESLFNKAGNPQTLKIIAQPDTHVKYRDHKAIKVFLKFLKYYQPHGLIIMGDFLDAEGISPWDPKDCAPRDFISEVIEARELLKTELSMMDHCVWKAFLSGNHENWIDQAFAAKLPNFFHRLDELGLKPDLKALLDLDKFGFDLFPVNEFLRLGKANFTHGLYTTDNHPKKHLEKIKANIYYGHLHDTKSYNTTSIDGPMEAHSLGCLCRLDAKFLNGKPNDWVHAFGIFEIFPDGSYTFICPKIINGRMSFNGIVFDQT